MGSKEFCETPAVPKPDGEGDVTSETPVESSPEGNAPIEMIDAITPSTTIVVQQGAEEVCSDL